MRGDVTTIEVASHPWSSHWDERKAARNILHRGVTFEYAARRLEATRIGYSDIRPLGEDFFRKATAPPPVKRQLTIRLDEDVLTSLKGHTFYTAALLSEI